MDISHKNKQAKHGTVDTMDISKQQPTKYGNHMANSYMQSPPEWLQ